MSKEKQTEKTDLHKEICESLNEIYRKKNADYGDSFGMSFDEFGPIAAVVRMDDKMRRLKQLLCKQAHVKDETFEDTVSDLANYAIMLLIELKQLEKVPF